MIPEVNKISRKAYVASINGPWGGGGGLNLSVRVSAPRKMALFPKKISVPHIITIQGYKRT